MNKKKRTSVERKLLTFIITLFVALFIRLIMFIEIILPVLMDHEKITRGGGDVIAFLYVGPLILVDSLLIVFFIRINIVCFLAKKNNTYTELAGKYRLIACLLLGIWFIFAMAIFLVFK